MTSAKELFSAYFSKWLIIFSLIWALIFFNFFPEPLELFARNWPLILIGIVGAIIGNVTSIGGGIVFIPVLMFIYKLDPLSSLKLAFVTQMIGMASGASGWLQRKLVPLHLLKWTVPPLIAGSIISSFLIHPSPLLIKGIFGPVSFLVGALVLLTINKGGFNDTLPSKAIFPLIFASLFGGIITGWVAIGEGEIVAAFCLLAYGLKTELAVGLGVVLLAINSIFLGSIHIFYFGGIPWDLAIFTMLGVLWGGRMGPFISQAIPSKKLKLVFSWVAILDGLFMTLQFLKVYLFK